MSDIGFDFVRAEPPFLLGVLGLGDARLPSGKYGDYVFARLKSSRRANDAANRLSLLEDSSLRNALETLRIDVLTDTEAMPSTDTYAIRFTVPGELGLDPLLVLSECVGSAKAGLHPLAWLMDKTGKPSAPRQSAEVPVAIEVPPTRRGRPEKRKSVLRPPVPMVLHPDQLTSQPVATPAVQPVITPAVAPALPLVEKAERLHTELQALGMEFGHAMGLGVHVARNDRGARFNNRRLDEIVPNLDRLPQLTMDRQLQSAYELIDLVLMDGPNVRVLFEFECTTSVNSGLNRMADLTVRQQHLQIWMIIVAPEERRAMVAREVTRPYLNPFPDQPFYERVRYMSDRQLRDLHDLAIKHPESLNLNILKRYSSGFEMPREERDFYGDRRARMQAGALADFPKDSLLG